MHNNNNYTNKKNYTPADLVKSKTQTRTRTEKVKVLLSVCLSSCLHLYGATEKHDSLRTENNRNKFVFFFFCFVSNKTANNNNNNSQPEINIFCLFSIKQLVGHSQYIKFKKKLILLCVYMCVCFTFYSITYTQVHRLTGILQRGG